MIDLSTNKPLKVSTECEDLPYIMLPLEQVDDVRALLDAHGLDYSVDELAISVDGKPALTVVNLKHGTNATVVQEILDAAA